jgi:hypothetical protein
MAWRILTIKRRRFGFGIAEAMMASTVLAIAVVGIAGPLGAASEQANILQERGTALVLARELLEEIAARPLCDGGTTCHLGPETGETSRAKFDSADDYHLYHDTTSALKNLSGQSIGFDPNALYSRDVTVEYRASAAGASASSGDYGLVTVTVTTPHKQVVKLARLLCKQALAF